MSRLNEKNTVPMRHGTSDAPLVFAGANRTSAASSARFARIALLVIAAAFLLGMLSVAFTQDAYAEVRKADVVSGRTVEERGLSVSECPSIDAEYAVLVDSDGTVYFSRGADEPSQIASITKVMTAMVAIDNAADGTMVVVSEDAALIGESTAGLEEGDILDFPSALKALMVPSGNDAAVALAETIGAQMIAEDPARGSDPVEAFVAAMNAKAAEIGCVDTLYENPHGLDDDEYSGDLHSTASDQAKVAQCAMGYQEIRDIVAGGSTAIEVERDGQKAEVELESTDELLELYEYAIGIKTGTTNLAGPCFMGAASKDGLELYSVVLGSSDEFQRFTDTANMFNWAYDHVVSVPLANTDEHATLRLDGESRDVPVLADVSHADWLDRTVKATLSDPNAAITVFDLEGNISQNLQFDELHGTVHPGDKVGTAVFKQQNQVVAEQDLIACETVEAPNPIDALAIWWARLVGGFDGSAAQAESKVYNVMPIIADNTSLNVA